MKIKTQFSEEGFGVDVNMHLSLDEYSAVCRILQIAGYVEPVAISKKDVDAMAEFVNKFSTFSLGGVND